MDVVTSPNKAYLATVLRTFAQIRPNGWTSDTLGKLYALPFPAPNQSVVIVEVSAEMDAHIVEMANSTI